MLKIAPSILSADFSKLGFEAKRADEAGADYIHIIPSDEMNNGWLKDIQAVPTTIFVDSNGKQIGKPYVGSRSQKDWQKIIDKILNK